MTAAAAERRPPIDFAYYPHIVETIVEAAPRPVLLSLRGVCREFCDSVDRILARHVSVCIPRSSLIGRGRAPLAAYIEGAEGRLPHLMRFTPGADTDGDLAEAQPAAARRPAQREETQDDMRLYLGPLARARVVDITGVFDHLPCNVNVHPFWTMLQTVEVVRTYDEPRRFKSPKTWVHFASLREPVGADIFQVTIPPVRLIVFNLQMDVDGHNEDEDGDEDEQAWTRWSVDSLSGMNLGSKAAPAIEELTVRFCTPRTGLSASLARRIVSGPVRSASSGPEGSVMNEVLWQISQVWVHGKPPPAPFARVTFVDLPDAVAVHPSRLGIVMGGAAPMSTERVRAAVVRQLRACVEKHRCLNKEQSTFWTPEEIDARVDSVEFITSDAYRARVGDEAYRLHTDPSTFERRLGRRERQHASSGRSFQLS